MRYAAVVGLFLALLLAGCSSVSIVPKPETGGIIGSADNSIRIVDSGLSVMTRVQDMAVGGYDIDTPIGSFYLVINNLTGHDLNLSLDNFKLVDSAGKVYQPMRPEEVNAILNPAISYFLPYPFIGYYDVVDLEQYRASSAMASERPYVGSGMASVERLIPLETGLLKNGMRNSGSLYFNIEISDQSMVILQAELPSGRPGKNLSFSFPFSIEKK
ncbi:MAG: hypothetical protein C0623_02145 [Desulfuromonas sp.]|nr:MAG: hypothetical protein C0623_02145 [Desulfuromonas sp.]